MKPLSIILLTSIIICLLIGTGMVKEKQFQERTFRLASLQEQMALVDLRCQKALHGSAGIICGNIGTEALLELEQLPGRESIRKFHAEELKVIEAYEKQQISEAEKNRVLDRLQIEVTKELDAAEANRSLSPFDFLLP